MKKITTLLFSLAICASGFSQFLESNITPHVPENFVKKTHTNNKTTATFQIDYDAAEEGLFSGSYSRFIWDINTEIADSAYFNNFIVTYDSIYDYVNFTGYTPGVDYTTIRLDSIFIAAGHTNNSATANTITVKVVSLDGAGYPQVASNLWDTVITTSTGLSTGNNWLQAMVLAFEPNLTLPSSTKFGVMVEFEGAQVDTFGILAGFNDGGACNTNTVSAVRSLFYANTYGQVTKYSTYGTLPTATGAQLYYDCDNSSSYTPNSNEDAFTQNGSIWVQVTIDPPTNSIEDLTNNVNYSVYPNPSSTGLFTVSLSSKSSENMNLVVRDIVGKTVITKNVKVSGQTQETISLADFSKGVYFLTIGNETTKLIVE